MSSVASTTRPEASPEVVVETGRVLLGIPVVPGVGAGPVVRPAERPRLPEVTDADTVAEADRAGELERFQTAAGVVAGRLDSRSAARVRRRRRGAAGHCGPGP